MDGKCLAPGAPRQLIPITPSPRASSPLILGPSLILKMLRFVCS